MIPFAVKHVAPAGAARLLVLLSALAGALPCDARADCPPYSAHNTGGDYTDPNDRAKLAVVEQFHFTAPVENLLRGISGTLGDDISYTLEHFPNHHRALAALAKLGLREKAPQPRGAKYTIGCFFERAIGFKSADPAVRTVYGAYLLASGQHEAALLQLREAARLDPDNPTTNYNLGLMYVKKKDYALALEHAHKAYGLGFPLPGLKNQLTAAGRWREPSAVPAPASAPLRNEQ
ncbi:MAG: tetratricopeptide repeat protein [Pseudomonadota bacterium]